MKPTFWMTLAFSGFLMTACSEKPPGCADDETRATAKQLIVDEARKQVSGVDDPEGLVKKFLDTSTVALSNIVDDGYRQEQKKQMCKAHIKVLPPDADGLEGDVAYSTQRVLDQQGKFLLEMENVDQFAAALVAPARSYYAANRYLGTYAGTYTCSGVGGAQDGPRGPFSMPASMVVTAQGANQPPQATLERLSRGGGVEKLAGQVSDAFSLFGRGENTPEDRWITHFDMKIEGIHATGTGEIRIGDFDIARRCTLDLVKGAAAADASQASPRTTSTTPTPSTTAQVAATSGADLSSGFAGKYVGTGDGTVTVEVGQPNASGSYPVSVATQASTAGGGGCGGSASGDARASGNALRLAETDKTLGTTCTVSLTPDGKGGLHSEEGDGCSAFHGAACGFSADLARR